MATQETKSMVSEVSICNQALGLLGQPAIVSLDQNNTQSRWMANNYQFIRDTVMEARMWSFAVDRKMSTVADLDEWEISYVHQMPVEWLMVYRVFSDVGGYGPEDWTISDPWMREGNTILAADSTVYLWGVKRIVDTGKFSMLFTQALAARIAADACIPLTENRQLQADMWNLYQAKMVEAGTVDSMQGLNQKIRSGNLTTRR
jgi:hypothetical protein